MLRQLLNDSRRTWMITVSMAILTLGYAFFLFLPQQKRLRSMRDELESKQQFVAQSQTLPLKIADTEQKLHVLRSFVDGWRTSAPQSADMPSMYQAITRAARQAGTRRFRCDPQPAEPMKTIRKIPVRLGSQGAFAEIFDWFRRIEQLPHTIWVEHMTLEPSGKGDDTLQCEASLAIFTGNPEKSD